MGSISTTFASVYRDYVTDGVPASGDHDPVKSEIRAIGPLIESVLGTLSLGSVSVTKTTRSLLNADLAHAANMVALVYADGTDANNDLYIKVGASGSGSWTLTNILHLAISGLANPFVVAATAASTLAGHYANDNTNTDVPGGSVGDRGAKYWASQAASILAAAVVPDVDKQIRNAYVPYVVFSDSHGASEQVGDSQYDTALIVGGRVLMVKDTLFNAFESRVWASKFTSDVECKVFIRSANTAFNMSTTTADATFTIPSGSFPLEDRPFVADIGARLFAASGKWVFFFFRPTDDSAIHIKLWSTSAGYRDNFLYYGGSPTGWNTAWTLGSGGSYCAVPPRLLQQDGEVATYLADLPPAIITTAPLKKYGLVGYECNLYFETIVPDPADSWTFRVQPSGLAENGKQQVERWTLTPTVANTSGTLGVRIIHKRTGQQLVEKTISLRVAAANAQTGTTKTVMVVGDSLISDGTITQTLLDNAAAEPGVMGVALIGTQGSGSNKHEGHPGSTVDQFTTSGSPFFNSGSGLIDVPNYLTTHSFAVPDHVFLQFNTNAWRIDALTDQQFLGNMSTNIGFFTSLIGFVRAAGANIKIHVVLPPWTGDQDAWGANFPGTAFSARAKRNYVLGYQMLVTAFGNSEGSKIYLVGSNTNMDPLTAFPRTPTLRHARIKSTTVATYATQSANLTPADGALFFATDAQVYFVKSGATTKGGYRPATELDGVTRRQTDCLHPITGGGGYKQIADEWWAAMKYLG